MARPVHQLLKLVLFAAIPCAVVGLAFGLESSHPTELARTASAGTWTYVVKDDDVLSTIAQTQLGTFRRYDEILALNPGIKERELTVGTKLRMPAREVASAVSDVPPPDTILLWLALGLVVLVGLVVLTASRLERHGYTRRAN